MASRKEQKEAARQRRLAEEQAAHQKTRRTRRLQMVGGVVVAAIIVVVVLVVVSSGGGGGASAKGPVKNDAQQVAALLKGIPQSGNTLGNPNAKVTYTEYGDLQCPICKDFSEGAEEQLIMNEVRSGKVKLVYRSFPTASTDSSGWQQTFPAQQAAAYAAGRQSKAWNYILLFYRQQQEEGTNYVNASYLDGLARAIPGLNYKQWSSQRFNPKYAAQVLADEKAATALNIQGTPSLIAANASTQTKPVDGDINYSAVQQMIKSVS